MNERNCVHTICWSSYIRSRLSIITLEHGNLCKKKYCIVWSVHVRNYDKAVSLQALKTNFVVK